MFNLWNRLRRKVAEAIIQGAADGLRALAGDDPDAPCDPAELRALFARLTAMTDDPKALPAADEEPAKKGRK